MNNPIYLDYCANNPVKKEVLDELCYAELKFYGNANSSHNAGILAHQFVEDENQVLRKCLNIPVDMEIIHTSSATEANNMAIKGIVDAYNAFGNKILVSGNQTMAYLARYYAKKNIKSFLGGALIPGTIGAGVYGNAGIKNINE